MVAPRRDALRNYFLVTSVRLLLLRGWRVPLPREWRSLNCFLVVRRLTKSAIVFLRFPYYRCSFVRVPVRTFFPWERASVCDASTAQNN